MGFRKRAYDLIVAMAVSENLSQNRDTQITKESHAAKLAKLEPEQQAEAWEESVATAPRDDKGEPKVTAKHGVAAC